MTGSAKRSAKRVSPKCSLKWGGLVQLTDGRKHSTAGLKGIASLIAKSKLSHYITRDPGDVLEGAWAPSWLVKLAAWAPVANRLPHSPPLYIQQNQTRLWLRTVVEAVEQDVDEHMAAVETLMALSDHRKARANVLDWARGVLHYA